MPDRLRVFARSRVVIILLRAVARRDDLDDSGRDIHPHSGVRHATSIGVAALADLRIRFSRQQLDPFAVIG